MATDNEIQKELEEVSPALAHLPRINPYSVPSGYFEQLPAAILAEVKQAKVVTIPPKRSIWRLAAAAAVAGAIFLGGWLFMQKHSSSDNTLANATDSSVQKQMDQVSEPEMAAYVTGNDIGPIVDTSSSAQIKDEDVPLVLADVSDQELQQYIDQENPSAKLN